MLQKRSRTLLRSVNQFLRSPATPTASFSNPLPAAIEHAQPIAAKKATPDSRYQPLPGWLASLTVGGVAAGIIAANLEEVPLTGRMQLQISFLQPRNDNTGMIPKPKLISYTIEDTAYVQDKKVTEQGHDLMLGICSACLSYRDPCTSAPCSQRTPVYTATYSQAAVCCRPARAGLQLS